MAGPTGAGRYTSGDWEVDLRARELRRGGAFVPLGDRAFEILVCLIEAGGRPVLKDDLMARIWPGTVVEENTLYVHISAIRQALGDDRDMIRTVSRRGYHVTTLWTERVRPDVPPLPVAETPEPFRPSSLPVSLTDLIGRQDAITALHDLVQAHRVVTLTGVGGIGKSVLAIEAARARPAAAATPVALVELASVSDQGLVASTTAGVLGLDLEASAASASGIAAAIGPRRLLLLLDNCEHVIDGAATLVEAIVRYCPHARVMATSREMLRVSGECSYRVAPLDVPPWDVADPDVALTYSSVQLLVARIRALGWRGELSATDAVLAAEVCRRLDGIPLAIEFAAARVASLGLHELASQLDNRFGLLRSGRRTALPRHQTLRAVLDWSYELLAEEECRIFRGLGVFAGGFTLEAASAVLAAPGTPDLNIANSIASLVEKSLVALDTDGPRYRMLETVRAHALEKLYAAGEMTDAGRKHAIHFRDLFEPPALAARAPNMHRRSALQQVELGNVRAALAWAFGPGGSAVTGVVLTASYVPAWLNMSLLDECDAAVERAIDHLASVSDIDDATRLQQLITLATAVLFSQRSLHALRAIIEPALALTERAGDVTAELRALRILWNSHILAGEQDRARPLEERYLRLARRHGIAEAERIAQRMIATGGHQRGNHADAIERLTRLRAAEPADNDMLSPLVLSRALCITGRITEAVACVEDSLVEATARGGALMNAWMHGLMKRELVPPPEGDGGATVEQEFMLYYIVLMGYAPIAMLIGDDAMLDRAAAVVLRHHRTRRRPFLGMFVRCLEAQIKIRRGDPDAGVALLSSTLDGYRRGGWSFRLGEFLLSLAEGLAALGRHDEALTTLGRAIAWSEQTGERWFLPELLRVRGEFCRGEDPEPWFGRALALAAEQGALFWELRASLSLARLFADNGERERARLLLSSVRARFSPTAESGDIRMAEALLRQLR